MRKSGVQYQKKRFRFKAQKAREIMEWRRGVQVFNESGKLVNVKDGLDNKFVKEFSHLIKKEFSAFQIGPQRIKRQFKIRKHMNQHQRFRNYQEKGLVYYFVDKDGNDVWDKSFNSHSVTITVSGKHPRAL